MGQVHFSSGTSLPKKVLSYPSPVNYHTFELTINSTFFLFLLQLAIVLEALSDGAVKMGMPRHLSTKLAAQVMMVSL